jgi:DedD protein
MENRLKERLTGAAILVALVVMLVPEMFHGQRGDVAAVASSSGEGPPVRSYTIDLSNSPTRTGPLQSTAVSSSGASDAAKPTAAPQPEQSSALTSAPADAAATASRPAEPAAAPAKPAIAAPRAETAAVAASSGSSHPTPVPSHNASQGGWAVQLGLFAKRDNAERLVHSAQAKGFTVSVANADAKGLYRVFASGMVDRAAAEAYAQRLKDHGLPAAVIAAP